MNKKIRVAFIAPDIQSEFHKKQLFLLNKYREEFNISVSIISPIMLHVASGQTKESSFPLFQLAVKLPFDAYIISSNTLLDIFGEDFRNRVISLFENKLLVSLSFMIKNGYSVIVNNKPGIKAIVKHLTQYHNYKKIGFIRGAPYHNEAQIRFQTFLECMKEAKLPIRDEWIFEGTFQSTTSEYIISDFLKERQELPEAIIAVNDNSAIGALKALKDDKRGSKIAVCGFDNIVPASYLGLTTVTQHTSKQLIFAIKLIKDKLLGKEPEKVITIDPSLIIRSSCGCTADALNEKEKKEHPLLRDDQMGGYNIGSISEFSRRSYDSEDFSQLKKSISQLLSDLRIESTNIWLFENGTPSLFPDENVPDDGGILFYSTGKSDVAQQENLKVKKNISLVENIENILKEFDSSMHIFSNLQYKNEYYGYFSVTLGDRDPLLIAMFKQELENALHNLFIQRTLNKTLVNLKASAKENQGLLNLLAHDINNPLCNILNSLELMKDQLPENEETLEYYRIAEKNIFNCTNIISDVLHLQRFKTEHASYSVDNIDPEDLCNELYEEFESNALQKKITLRCRKSFENHSFRSNAEMLKSIFRNLLSNAVKFSPIGENIDLSMSTKPSLSTKKTEMIFTISDRGQGFTDEDKTKLFSPFQPLSANPTGSESSTGLGLSIVKVLTDQLNGKIILESKSGEGSSFTLIFPESEGK